ncbi:Sodium-independent sulfate anion transporter [Armadillidium nasatum]|uniref:Sodium-independent sulfate anion transporter n=1 Tax=Armadillidium nasatum TaxID=96803 RepID=A0A5N5SKI9_9CRUS|nr:Sodium-independent sulfate anion transporter [Armadillidium nasatum]
MSLMTYQYSNQGGADYAILLCFLAGVIEIFAGIVNLGFFINFISHPVISGFTSAAAITIASSQLKGLFGLKIKTGGVVDTWVKVGSHIQETIWQDAVLGLSCIIILSGIKEKVNGLKLEGLEQEINTKAHRHCTQRKSQDWKNETRNSRERLKKCLFYLNVSRNALIVFIASLIAFCLDGDSQPFTLTGNVTSGIPSPQLPPFSTTINNQTMAFGDIINDIGIGVIMVPFIAILDDIAVVSSWAKGKSFDVTQEIIALGFINLLGSFFGSLPTTASLSRTAVNVSSGVRTPAGGLLTGAIVLVALAVLTPFFRYIPKATLAAVIICAVMHMFDYEIIKSLWRTKRLDVVHLLVTFFGCLFIGLEWGILLGIGVNLLIMLFKIATPTVRVEHATFPRGNCPFILVTPNNGMLYPNVMHIKTIILKAGLKEGNGTRPVVIDCSHIIDFDYTSCKGLAEAMDVFTKREQPLIFLNLKPKLITMIKSLKDEITSYDSLEDAEDMLYNYSKALQKEEYSSDPNDQEANLKLTS